MMKYSYILLVSFLFISCGTKKKVVQSTPTTTIVSTPTTTKTKTVTSTEIKTNSPKTETKTKTAATDSVLHVKNVKFTKSNSLGLFDHNSWNTLLQTHVTPDGKVNYKGFKKDRTALRNYISSLGDHMPTENWSKEDKLAYWINAYNAMTVDLILRNYPVASIKDISKPWNQRLWKLGNKWYNLDEIEHKILRKMNEPRIHFAINCASFSCPPLINEAFKAENLEAQLTQVTKTFLADTQRNTITPDKIEISKIFQWFSKDFKQNGSLIDFLNTYSAVKISPKAKKKYKKYNWNLNE